MLSRRFFRDDVGEHPTDYRVLYILMWMICFRIHNQMFSVLFEVEILPRLTSKITELGSFQSAVWSKNEIRRTARLGRKTER